MEKSQVLLTIIRSHWELTHSRIPDLDTVMTILGRYFQIRDDYMNLESAEVCPFPTCLISGADKAPRSTLAKKASAKISTKANFLSL